MNFNNIPSGLNIPDDIFTIIEISYGNSLVKYEISRKYNNILVDRFINTPIFYPFNYGYINKTLSKDGDCLDVVLLCDYSINTGTVIHSRPIGVLKMVDELGKDDKIIAVPNYNISSEYNNIHDISDISKLILRKVHFFFNNYKFLNKNKWVEIDNWYGIDESKKLINKSFLNYKKNNI